MGMGYGANYGYVVELTEELMGKMGITEEEKEEMYGYGALIESKSPTYNKVEKFLNTDDSFYIYQHSDGDRYDELEEGHLYIIFDQDFLFGPKIKTEGFKRVSEKLGKEPQHSLWVTFG